jgi:hypothetical protein
MRGPCIGQHTKSLAISLARAVVTPGHWRIEAFGLAHVGMLPNLVQDLRQIGVSDNDLTPLFRSAEGSISMWEKAERAKP